MQRLLSAMILVSFCGCGGAPGDAPSRRIVEGEITFNAAPIHRGAIRFIPEPDGPIATAEIKEGRYRVENKGGVPIGQVRIEISAEPDTSEINEDAILSGRPVTTTTIPEKYNKSSTLVETIPKGSDAFVLNFHLKDE